MASRLGERVLDAYRNGVSFLVAADLEMLSAANVEGTRDGSTAKGPVHLIFERKVVAGQSLNSGKLVFDGMREGLASWLAPPAPMGSLNFFTPQTSAVVALLMKRPAEVLKDITSLAPSGISALQQLAKVEAEWNVRLREDIAEALGSEVAFAIDGPLLPQPSWKLVVEVDDAVHLERGIESLLRRANQELHDTGAGKLLFEQEQVGAFNYHRVKARDSVIPFEVNYAFVDGYLVMTPTSALLSRAIQAHARGDTLAHSDRFKDILPQDGQTVLSGLVFQDLMSLVATTLDAAEVPVAPEFRQSFGKLSRGSKPTLIGFYGREDSIEMVGSGDLLPMGPEALALPDLLRHTFPGAFHALEN
jgi:hypothetical protein